jgi:hypothetical protein
MSTEQQFKESTGLLLSPFFVEIMNELADKKSGVTYDEMRDHIIKTVIKPADEEYDPDFLNSTP